MIDVRNPGDGFASLRAGSGRSGHSATVTAARTAPR